MTASLAPPNLFSWATSELSQDAFICWLLEWAMPENASIDAEMHQSGLDLINAMLEKHDVRLGQIRTLKIHRQYFNIDVLVIINGEYALLIEDKTHTESHGDQLFRYKKTVAERYPKCELLPLFVKTGNQSGYSKETRENYRVFLRADFLKVLERARARGNANNILLDFLGNMATLERHVQSFLTKPVKEWNWHAWEGFYQYLQTEFPGLEWKYVANPSGGFLGAWWFFHVWNACDVYLQIEHKQRRLCFKICVENAAQQTELRQNWHKRVLRSASELGFAGVKRPARLGKGIWMTVAVVEGEDWLFEKDGRVDLPATLSCLMRAQEVLIKSISESNEPDANNLQITSMEMCK